MKFSRCHLLLTDGARPDVYKQLLDEGRLPNIKRYLTDKGSFLTAVTSFPSTTGPAHLPFLTGCHAGTCNMPGIRWFDRARYAKGGLPLRSFRSYVGPESFLMNYDLRPGIKTFFDLIPNSANVLGVFNRGVSSKGNKSKISRLWYSYYAHLTDRWNYLDQVAGDKLCKVVKEENPEFVFALLPAVDEFSHISSPHHEATHKAYEQVDAIIGRLARVLEQKGILEETLIAIVSDHGLSETRTHFEINDFLEAEGIKTFYYPYILKRGFTAVNMVSGNGMSNLYFKSEKGWKAPMFDEELWAKFPRVMEGFLERPEIDIMITKNISGAIVIRSKRGQATLNLQGEGRLQYRLVSQDPFGFPPLPALMTEQESLDKTFHSNYPDVLFQLIQFFRSERAGDLILSAAKGCDLRQRFEIHEHKASHGSLCREHMLTPFISNASLVEIAMRTADVFPTLLNLLGRQPPQGIDGRSLKMKETLSL